jgi:hypothetical protein
MMPGPADRYAKTGVKRDPQTSADLRGARASRTHLPADFSYAASSEDAYRLLRLLSGLPPDLPAPFVQSLPTAPKRVAAAIDQLLRGKATGSREGAPRLIAHWEYGAGPDPLEELLAWSIPLAPPAEPGAELAAAARALSIPPPELTPVAAWATLHETPALGQRPGRDPALMSVQPSPESGARRLGLPEPRQGIEARSSIRARCARIIRLAPVVVLGSQLTLGSLWAPVSAVAADSAPPAPTKPDARLAATKKPAKAAARKSSAKTTATPTCTPRDKYKIGDKLPECPPPAPAKRKPPAKRAAHAGSTAVTHRLTWGIASSAVQGASGGSTGPQPAGSPATPAGPAAPATQATPATLPPAPTSGTTTTASPATSATRANPTPGTGTTTATPTTTPTPATGTTTATPPTTAPETVAPSQAKAIRWGRSNPALAGAQLAVAKVKALAATQKAEALAKAKAQAKAKKQGKKQPKKATTPVHPVAQLTVAPFAPFGSEWIGPGHPTPGPDLTLLQSLTGLYAKEPGPPAYLIPIYQSAGHRYHISWKVLAAINAIETDYGLDLSTSSAGAMGWMQFMPETWKAYGVDMSRTGHADPYDPRDAIFAAAKLLAANGGRYDIAQALFAYNHADWYVEAVLWRAAHLGRPTGPTGNPLTPKQLRHGSVYQLGDPTIIPITAHFSTDSLGRVGTLDGTGADGLGQGSKAFGATHGNETVAERLAQMMAAGNEIASEPYVWGGGHQSWRSWGYDCSGSVSYVLHAAGLLDSPEVSGSLESYGLPGPGKYVTIYANGSHVWMTVNGWRFDTVALSSSGTRWSSKRAGTGGFVIRHPAGM